MNRPAVKVALGLAEGVARGDSEAEGLLVAGFDSAEEAARAHAYLTGYLLQLLADARDEDLPATAHYVRNMLDH